MKNKRTVSGAYSRRFYSAAIAAVIGCLFAACGGGGGADVEPPVPAYVGGFTAAGGNNVVMAIDSNVTISRAITGSNGLISGTIRDADGAYGAIGVYDNATGIFLLSTSGSAKNRYSVYGAMNDAGLVSSSTANALDKTQDYKAASHTVTTKSDSVDQAGISLEGGILEEYWGRWQAVYDYGQGVTTHKILNGPFATLYHSTTVTDGGETNQDDNVFTFVSCTWKTDHYEIVIAYTEMVPSKEQTAEAFKAIIEAAGLATPTWMGAGWNPGDPLTPNSFGVESGGNISHNLKYRYYSSQIKNYARDVLHVGETTRYQRMEVKTTQNGSAFEVVNYNNHDNLVDAMAETATTQTLTYTL